jgi:FMN phosphatase YigB (HAD superfamily)
VSKQKAIICDLDGTLCDLRHRLHYMEHRPKMRDEFHAAAKDDAVYTDVLDILIAYRAAYNYDGRRILLVTCRPETYRVATEVWLYQNLVPYDELIMRADGDTREDSLIKSLIYRYEIEPHYDVQFVLEDKNSVVQMWRNIGLTCWQVRTYDA